MTLPRFALLMRTMVIPALIGFAQGCAPAAQAELVAVNNQSGATLPEAREAMRADGVIFAPYQSPPWLGAELSQQHVKCIEAVNRTVFDVLTKKFLVYPPPPELARRYGNQPRWARSPSGPRAAVHIKSFRCGNVRGDGDSVTTPLEVGKSPKPRPDAPSEVILDVLDRRSGAVVFQVKGRSGDDEPLAASRAAARAAVDHLAQ